LTQQTLSGKWHPAIFDAPKGIHILDFGHDRRHATLGYAAEYDQRRVADALGDVVMNRSPFGGSHDDLLSENG